MNISKIFGYVLAIPNFILLEFFAIVGLFMEGFRLEGKILISIFSVLFFVGSFLVLRKSTTRSFLKYFLILITVSVFMFVVYFFLLIAWLFSGPL